MNLFVLDKDFDANARAHVNRHVTKMQIEAAQILCTALNLPFMKPTHKHHPCVKWAEKTENAVWIARYGRALNREYVFRYDKYANYKTPRQVFNHVLENFGTEYEVPKNFVLAMPDEFKQKCPIESYRAYYRGAKQHLHAWKNREKPEWI